MLNTKCSVCGPGHTVGLKNEDNTENFVELFSFLKIILFICKFYRKLHDSTTNFKDKVFVVVIVIIIRWHCSLVQSLSFFNENSGPANQNSQE